MITIRVVDSSGYGVSGADVHISWGGSFFDSTHSSGRTDGSGNVSFNVSPGSGTILVNGKQVHSGYISGNITVKKI